MENQKLVKTQSLRKKIIDAARELFDKEGCQQLSARKVAQKAGCSLGSIYVYFESMDALYIAIVEKNLGLLTDNLFSINDADPLQEILEACKAYIYFGLEHPEEYRVAFIYLLKSGPIHPHSSFEFLSNKLFNYVRAKNNKSFDYELLAQNIWTQLHGLVSLLIQKPGFPWQSKNKLIDATLNSIMLGLKW